ncbi:HDOD domain-containing protein [Desulfonatronum lacustre]|uniref:HDOD domain-containing protein n=1 Tax=Desulfonatronum lacustre TaxID=66849 RepID=UPI000490D12F|nr:HDOD domain-containing protein [Desulfonatronum lacustre]
MKHAIDLPTSDELKRVITLEGSRLPSFPQAALKFLEMVGDEDVSVKDMARVIESDPGIAAKVLAMVNAAGFGLRRKISTLTEALVFLGIDEIRKLCIGMTVFQGLFATSSLGTFGRIHFWRHSLSVAVLSMELAKKLQFPNPEEAYVAGLLHDVGKIFLDLQGHRDYGDFLHDAGSIQEPIVDLERKILGLGHDDVGAYFCSLWGLPESIILPVKYHHQRFPAEDLPTDQSLLISIVALSNFICWTQGVGSFESETICPPVLAPEIERFVDLDKIDVIARIRAMNSEMERISEFYRFVFPTPGEIQESMLWMSFSLARVNTRLAHRDVTQTTHDYRQVSGNVALHDVGFAFGKSLAQAGTAREVMDIVMFHIGSFFEPMHWAILLKDSKSEGVIFSAVEGLNKERLQGLRVPKGKGLSGYLAERDMPLISENIFQDAHLAGRMGLYVDFEPLSCMGTLLKINQKFFGVVELVNKMNGLPYTPEELKILESITEQASMAIERLSYQQSLRKMATTDSLTGLKNRCSLERMLSNRDLVLRQYGHDLSIMIIDIDRFKRINEMKGRKAADEILKQVAGILRSAFRKSDNVFRYEGDKFIALLPGTDRQAADQARMRMLKSFDALKGDMGVTISIFVHSVKSDHARGLITFLEERLAQDKAVLECTPDASVEAELQPLLEQETAQQPERKRIYRKKVRLDGVFERPSANSYGNILVEELALTEIGFRVTTGPLNIKPGDFLEVSFRLDDTLHSLIERRVVVRSVQGEQVDAEFYNPPPYAKDLGFYLLA